MSALVFESFTPSPSHHQHQRQNRRRERPGSRSRRTITRKSQIQDTCLEGIDDAQDPCLYLPSVKASPSPLLRQSFDQSWERWKAREVEEKALAELDKTQLEQEQRRLFGGDVGDDELLALGILYGDRDATGASVDEEERGPAFVIRFRKPRHSRRSAWEKLSIDIPFYELRNDATNVTTPIFLPPQPSIQHRASSSPVNSDTSIIPQSLPATPVLESIPESSNFLDTPPSPSIGDWTFVHTTHHTPPSIPLSEPETWILLGDDS